MNKRFQIPSFLMSTSGQCTKFVNGEKERHIHKNGKVHYGITWNKDYIFVGVRPNSVVVLDSNYNVVNILGHFDDMHQILFTNEKLHVTRTKENSVSLIDLSSFKEEVKNWTDYDYDVNHINSIFFDGKDYWVFYHNRENISQVVKVDNNLENELEVINLGSHGHNVFVDENYIYSCDSSTGNLLRLNILTKEVEKKFVGRFIRGLAVNDDLILIGSSGRNERENRHLGDAMVDILRRDNLEILDTLTFRNYGSIYDLRIIDGPDYAHNGIKFPGN